MKTPTIKELIPLIKAVKANISDECLAFMEDEIPGIQLTVACNDNGGWSYQTGDNSFSGGAYHYPHWAVVGVYRDSNCREIAKDIKNQLAELLAY